MAAHTDESADHGGKRIDPPLFLAGVASLAGLGWLVSLLVLAPAPPPLATVSYRPPPVLATAPEGHPPAAAASPTWQAVRSQGVDSAGRAVIFELMTAEGLAWARGGTAVQGLADGRSQGLAEALARPPLASALASARAVIVVGAAAFDETSELAARRAERLAQAVGRARPVWRLDLGRALSPCLACAAGPRAAQRPLLLLGVSAAHEGADLAQALRDGLARHSPTWALQRYEQFRLSAPGAATPQT